MDDGAAAVDMDEPSFTDISPSQSQFNKGKPNDSKAMKLNNVHNPFVESNNVESPSAPSSGYTNEHNNH